MQVRTIDEIALAGSSVVLRRPPSVAQCHQFDYAFHCHELRSVDFTAALNDNSLLRAVDATDASSSGDEIPSVGATDAI